MADKGSESTAHRITQRIEDRRFVRWNGFRILYRVVDKARLLAYAPTALTA